MAKAKAATSRAEARSLDRMPDIDQATSQRIANAARAVNIAKATMERARTFDERLQCQRALDAAEAEMIAASMQVNRGISRAAPTA